MSFEMSRVRAKEVFAGRLVADLVEVRDRLEGLAEALPDGELPGSKLAPRTVGSSEIADGSVTARKLGADVLSSGGVVVLEAKSVTEEKIADSAVTTAKIRDSAVTRLKIAEGAVGGGNIAEGVVDASKIAPLAVSEGKLASGAVSASKIQGGAVHGSKIVAEAVETYHIADSAVTAAKLQDGAVGTRHVRFENDDASASSTPVFKASTAETFELPEDSVEVSLDLGPQFNGLTVARLSCLIVDGADMVGSFAMRVTLKHQLGSDVAQVYRQVVTDLDLSPDMVLLQDPVVEVYSDDGNQRMRIGASVGYPGLGLVAVRFVVSGTVDKLVF